MSQSKEIIVGGESGEGGCVQGGDVTLLDEHVLVVVVSRAFHSATVVSSVLFFCDHLPHPSQSFSAVSGCHSGFIFHCTNPQDGVIKSYVKYKRVATG